MKTNKKFLAFSISTILSITYVDVAQATDDVVRGTTILNDGGNVILNDGDSIIFNDDNNTDNVYGVKLNTSSDSLKINGSGTISIISDGNATAISATNGGALDLGSGTVIETNSSNGQAIGLTVDGASTVNGNNLTIHSTASLSAVTGIYLKNANSYLTGNTEINAITNGFATGIQLDPNSTLIIDKLTLNVENDDGYGLYIMNGSKLTLGDGSSISVTNDNALYARGTGIEVNLNKATINTEDGYAINAQTNAIVNLGTGTTINSKSSRGVGVWVLDNSQLLADNLTVNHVGNYEAFQAYGGGTIKIGENSHLTSSVGGISALSGSSIIFEGTADNRNSIVAHAKWAVNAQSSGTEITIKNTDIVADNSNGTAAVVGLYSYNQGVINAENTTISVDDTGTAVSAKNGGIVTLSEKTEINAGSHNKSALATSGTNSQINVTGQALINGNIFASGSGSLIDIDATNSSVINGYTTIDTENPGASLNVKLTDSAWHVTDDSHVTSLTINNSTINFTKDEFETLTADSLNGTDGVFNMRTDIVGQQGDLIEINGTAQGNYKLNITNNGSEATDGLETLTVVKTADNQASFTLAHNVELGAYEYNLRSVTDSVNDVELYSTGQKKSSSAEAASSFLTIGYLSNYVENQTLLQRLGDLRNGQIMNNQTDGFWIKGYGGKLNSFSGNGLNGFDANYVGTMLGADKEIDIQNGHLFVGGMVGFTRMNPDYRQGSGNGKNYSASLYATYLLDDGLYFDGLLKYNALKNRFNVSDTAGESVKGHSKTQGISLSAELGKRFWLSENNQGGYIEPQMQLTYGYQNGDTVHSSNGLKVQLSHYNSVLLRAGSLFGYQMQGDNPANFYVKLGMIRELDSDASYRFNNGEKQSYNFKSGWFNGGLGANINVNKQHSFYTEADVSAGHSFNNLTFNAGYRFTF